MPPVPPPQPKPSPERFRRLRRLLHRRPIASIDTDSARLLEDRDAVREQVRCLIDEIQESRGTFVSDSERRYIDDEILEKLRGWTR